MYLKLSSYNDGIGMVIKIIDNIENIKNTENEKDYYPIILKINEIDYTLLCSGYNLDGVCSNPLFSITKAEIIRYDKNNLSSLDYIPKIVNKITEWIDDKIKIGDYINSSI